MADMIFQVSVERVRKKRTKSAICGVILLALNAGRTIEASGSGSIFLESRLKADFDTNYNWPLADATFYGEDLGKASVSEAVAGTIAKSLSGSYANSVLDRLLRNPTNALVYSYVDITSYAVRANLPADVVRVLPWEKVTNGPTGAPPDGMPGFINVLVQLGQLFYDGLVALGTFSDLAEAIGA